MYRAVLDTFQCNIYNESVTLGHVALRGHLIVCPKMNRVLKYEQNIYLAYYTLHSLLRVDR